MLSVRSGAWFSLSQPMKTYQIKSEGQTFTTNNAAAIAKAPVGSTVEVIEMTEADYQAIPATSDSHRFFG